jgi:hypothetical protein
MNQKGYIISVGVALLALAGCSTIQQETNSYRQSGAAAEIGCSPEEITISDVKAAYLGMMQSFKASCKGRTYQCRDQADSGIRCSQLK